MTRRKKKQRRLRPQPSLTTKIKSTQKRWPDRRRRQSKKPNRKHRKMVALRRPTKSTMTRCLRRDRHSLEELP
jgi:hypothetical protein